MPSWSAEQRARLALERSILQCEMPQFQFYNLTSNTYVEGWASISSGSNRYKLKAQLPPEYPYEPPGLYVSYPRTLWRFGGVELINSMGTTHAFHTDDNDDGSCV